MSIYMTFDENAGDQVASTGGWNDFVTWVNDHLPPKDYAHVHDLIDSGYTVEPFQLFNELMRARIVYKASAVEGLETTIQGMCQLLSINSSQEIVMVTDGMVKNAPEILEV